MTCPRCDEALASATKWCPHCGFQQLLPATLGPTKPLSRPLLRGTPTPVPAGSGSSAREVSAVFGILVVTGLLLLAMSVFPGEGDTPAAGGGQSLSEPPADTVLVPGPDGDEPTPEAWPSGSASPSSGASASPLASASGTPSSSPAASATPSPTNGPTASGTAKPSPTAKPTGKPGEPRKPRTPKPTSGPTRTQNPTPQPSATPEPTPTIAPTPTPTPTPPPTPVPTVSVPVGPSPAEAAKGLKPLLNCGNLVSSVSYPVAVEYWRRQLKPLWLDWNLDGRPCNETGFYSAAVVKAYFG